MHILPEDDSSNPPSKTNIPEPPAMWRILSGPWLIAIVLGIGWLPLFVADVLIQFGMGGPHFGLQFGMGWGFGIALPASAIAIFLLVFHVVRAAYRHLSRH
jgi:hypothetical protein